MKIPASASRSRWSGPLGPMDIVAHDAGVVGIWFETQKHAPDLADCAVKPHPLLTEVGLQLGAYFEGRLRQFDLPLDLSGGTVFQQDVWAALLGVACGDTISYSTLAQRTGRSTAVRAVASAVGRNPVSVVVPCHRILGSNGSLTGYAGGLHRKAALLDLENRKP
ncbi:methylated-DNA--[protein]-cysteine S-methyltransferase [Rhodoferax sp.]|uniref:methylated-DNA--[protein]-cysteine S-methyltransferase n=1 Tax=Rhodoferax sp. TaxID=50421 RepID=UPI0026012C59|nr:methylated-DNA--[protein]-cysteine S-methyltransferase [Rhodoferax sp.]